MRTLFFLLLLVFVPLVSAYNDPYTFTPGQCDFVNVTVAGSLPIVEDEFWFNCNKSSNTQWTCNCSPVVMSFNLLAYNNYTVTYQEYVWKSQQAEPVSGGGGSWWLRTGRFQNRSVVNTSVVNATVKPNSSIDAGTQIVVPAVNESNDGGVVGSNITFGNTTNTSVVVPTLNLNNVMFWVGGVTCVAFIGFVALMVYWKKVERKKKEGEEQ